MISGQAYLGVLEEDNKPQLASLECVMLGGAKCNLGYSPNTSNEVILVYKLYTVVGIPYKVASVSGKRYP